MDLIIEAMKRGTCYKEFFDSLEKSPLDNGRTNEKGREVSQAQWLIKSQKESRPPLYERVRLPLHEGIKLLFHEEVTHWG